MVLAELWLERRERKAREEGRQLQQAEWEAWLQRLEKAEAKGEPFTEPPPVLENRRRRWF